MIIASLLGSVLGLVSEYWFTIDWWKPITITHTRIGLEDALFGFGYTGILVVISKIIYRKTNNISEINLNIIHLLLPISISFLTFVTSFYIFRSNSFQATLISLLLLLTYLLLKNWKLWRMALLGCFGILSLAIIENAVLNLLFPGWIEAFYLFRNVPNKLILGISIDDFMWYGLTALSGSIIFESVFNLNIRKRS